MKNIVKLMSIAAVVATFTACQGNGNGNRGTMDSVATRTDSNGSSTTVDTMPRTDTAMADTGKK
ncbi:hypothetical protein KHS38_03315 [Mucilaginibacter sp. Bleaf8]|uniref:hypothetical protein n=1 Tax=Mucilaginibacter sp. Bleaf8 TaxID=2834430 RepID=UPI001BD0528C|nr:hypothetical protein [Mucilaginibacter sp. Bleaf8]MBS7563423.1 hypothetical protein [Mucilaginibacter sp. Bleaf8]